MTNYQKIGSSVLVALSALFFLANRGDAWFEFASRPWLGKHPVYSANGIISTMHPLASQAGIEIMQQGGNAFDAGIAAALTLTAVETWMGGIAGTSFYLIYDAEEQRVRALDADNLAPVAATPDRFTRQTLSEGLMSMGVPGALAGHSAVLERYGTMSFAQVVQPALRYLEEGFVMSPDAVDFAHDFCAHCPSQFPNFARIYAPDGQFPRVGELMRNPALANTYRIIADRGIDAFYRGDIAREMVDYMQANGGLWTMEDLASYEPVWRDPVVTRYREYDVFGCPPPSSSITWMQTLKILEGYDLKAMGHNSREYIHHFLEAERLAHADGYQFVADPAFVESPLEAMLSDSYAKVQRRRIDSQVAASGRVRHGRPLQWSQNPDAAELPSPAPLTPQVSPADSLAHPVSGCTSHVIVADAEGNYFTFTHTLGNIYGGHDVLGDTGVLGSNSLDWFDLDENIWSGESSNLVLEPGKRNRYTLSPGMILKDGKPIILIGGSAAETTMPGITQVLLNMLEFGLDPQAAIAAPRVIYGDALHWTGGTRVGIDREIAAVIGDSLAAMGHDVVPVAEMPRPLVGMVNAVAIDPETGTFVGGAEIRMDGHVSGY